MNEKLEKAAKKKGVDPNIEERLKDLEARLEKRAASEAALQAEVGCLNLMLIPFAASEVALQADVGCRS